MVRIRDRFVITFLYCLLIALPAFSQLSEQETRKRLDVIYNGMPERVRTELPALYAEYPNDPAVIYLDAVLTSDGMQAVKKYQTIVDKFPASEWADDALYKIYQYYYSIGLYKTAEQKLAQLTQQYPHSLYVAGPAHQTTPAVEKAKTPSQPVVLNPKNDKKQEDTATVKKSELIQPPGQKPIIKSFEKKPEDTLTVKKYEPAQPAIQKITTTPAVKKREPVSTVPTTEQAGKRYAVQAGAYSTRDVAQKQVDFFSTIGKTAIITRKESGGKTLYIVTIEGFTQEDDARNFIAELKSQHNIESIIVPR
jgi:cell division protein FtsN